MADRISSVYDIPEWLAEKFPELTGPARAAYNSALLPVDAGADALRRGTHGALGLEEQDPGKFTRERVNAASQAVQDAARPATMAMGGLKDAASGGMDWLRQLLVQAGAKPTQAAPAGADMGNADTELRRGVPPAPQRRVVPQANATTPAGAGNTSPVTTAPRGAIATDPWEQASAESATQNAMMGAVSTEEAETPAAQPNARKSLSDRYNEAVSGIDRNTKGDLTEDQKKQMQLDFFLSLLAKGSKRGSTFLGSAAESGLDVSGKVRGQQEGNKRDAKDRIRDQRDEAFRGVSLADKDDDNIRSDRKLSFDEGQAKERMSLLRRQIDQGKWRVQETERGLMLWDQESGQSKPLLDGNGKPLKLPAKASEGDPAQVRIFKYVESLPPEQRARFLQQFQGGKDKNDADQMLEIIRDGLKDDPRADINVLAARASSAAEAARNAARGGQPAALPNGVPRGSKQIGTSGGKAVYEAPDGKRYKAE